MKLPQFAIDYLLKVHKQARKYPYYHIPSNDGNGMYMDRMWIMGARSPERNDSNPRWKRKGFIPPKSSWLYRAVCRLIAIRAHTTFRSDPSKDNHDHPSMNISVVLAGGYWEVGEPTERAKSHPGYYAAWIERIEDGYVTANDGADILSILADYNIHWRGPGSIVFRRAKTPHRLILPPNTVCKSIFIMGPAINNWGFYVDGVKVGWKKYLGVE